jgi:hypothetical protein
MVRYKTVPGPCDLDRVQEIHAAVPADPEATDDCCARLCTVGSVQNRDAAREWLPFLTALGLASRTDAGYHRLDWRERAHLAESFENHVLGANELLGVVERDGPMSVERLFVDPTVREAVVTGAPEQHESPHQQRAIKSRIERLVGWSEVLGLLSRNSAGEFVRTS